MERVWLMVLEIRFSNFDKVWGGGGGGFRHCSTIYMSEACRRPEWDQCTTIKLTDCVKCTNQGSRYCSFNRDCSRFTPSWTSAHSRWLWLWLFCYTPCSIWNRLRWRHHTLSVIFCLKFMDLHSGSSPVGLWSSYTEANERLSSTPVVDKGTETMTVVGKRIDTLRLLRLSPSTGFELADL